MPPIDGNSIRSNHAHVIRVDQRQNYDSAWVSDNISDKPSSIREQFFDLLDRESLGLKEFSGRTHRR